MSVTVAFVHLGREGGGVPRYGRLLADGARHTDEIDVLDVEVGGREASIRDVAASARAANAADVIHLQWKIADWGGAWRGAARLAAFLARARRPVVATLHDVYDARRRRDRLTRPEAWALRLLGLRARRVVVHGEEERRRLRGLVRASKLDVVPHFVEEPRRLPDGSDAKRELGLADRRVVTLLGFITERKGHRLLLDALPLLPADVSVVIAGAPIAGRDHRRKELEEQAERLGVVDRVVFTGYVGDAMLARVLAATDVAACPFRDVSASGSLSTWISAGTRIVASDLPAIREYEAFVGGGIRRFAPRTKEALAAGLRAALDDAAAHPGPDPLVQHLGEALAVPKIVERYVAVWQRAAAA